jgi:hypothetical protein
MRRLKSGITFVQLLSLLAVPSLLIFPPGTFSSSAFAVTAEDIALRTQALDKKMTHIDEELSRIVDAQAEVDKKIDMIRIAIHRKGKRAP